MKNLHSRFEREFSVIVCVYDLYWIFVYLELLYINMTYFVLVVFGNLLSHCDVFQSHNLVEQVDEFIAFFVFSSLYALIFPQLFYVTFTFLSQLYCTRSAFICLTLNCEALQ